MAKRIVIIGGSGFVGCNAVRYFSTSHNVYVIDKNLSTPHLSDQITECIKIDIRDKLTLSAELSRIDPHYILHLASKSTVIECHESPEEAFLDNVLGCLNVLSVSQNLVKTHATSLQRVVVHTSDKVYGEHPEANLPYLENYPHYGADVYSTSKAAQDMMSICWGKYCDVPVSTVRSGNIYGPWDYNFSRLIPCTIKKLLQGESPVVYEGQGATKRDFIYIDDVLRAYECIFLHGIDGEAFNLGASGAIRVEDVINMIKFEMKMENIPTITVKRDLPEFKAQYLDYTRLQTLGWAPQVCLADGLQRCIQFYSQNILALDEV